MSPKCRVRIILHDMPAERARTIADILYADNGDTEDCGMKITCDDGRMVLDFEGDRGLRRLVGAVDGILGQIQSALGDTR